MVTEKNRRIYQGTGSRGSSSFQDINLAPLSAYRKTEAMLDDGEPTVASVIGSYTDKIISNLKKTINKVSEGINTLKTKSPTNISTSSDWKETAYNLLIKKEGFRENAYFDRSLSGNRDGYRVGFGSGTITRGDEIINVTENSVVTRAEAEADLKRRLNTEFGPRTEKASGDTWETLSNNSKAALTSIVYNAGNLPKVIKDALKTGDQSAIAEAIKKSGEGTILEEEGYDVTTLVEGLLRGGVVEGYHSIDVSLAIKEPIINFIVNIMDAIDIEYKVGDIDDNDDDEDEDDLPLDLDSDDLTNQEEEPMDEPIEEEVEGPIQKGLMERGQ